MSHHSGSQNSLPAFRLFLLGSFHLEKDRKTICLPTRKVEALFAYLVLFPEQHSREKLAALLWGDSTDEHARHSLRTALAAIRKELGDEILLTDRETIELSPDHPLWVDALAFQAQANKFLAAGSSDPAAINFELYQNHLLTDFYDDWIIPERERLHLLYLDALLQLAQQYRSASDYARAIEIAQKVLATDRANEKAYQHLMLCYAAMGERIAALKKYDECKRVLHDELAVEPSSETLGKGTKLMVLRFAERHNRAGDFNRARLARSDLPEPDQGVGARVLAGNRIRDRFAPCHSSGSARVVMMQTV